MQKNEYKTYEDIKREKNEIKYAKREAKRFYEDLNYNMDKISQEGGEEYLSIAKEEISSTIEEIENFYLKSEDQEVNNIYKKEKIRKY